MHNKIPKICTGCRVSAAKIYLYYSTKIAKARPQRVEWQTYSSVQKQWFMRKHIFKYFGWEIYYALTLYESYYLFQCRPKFTSARDSRD